MFPSTRRDFLKTTTVAGAAIALGEFTLRSTLAAVPEPPAAGAVGPPGSLPKAPSWIDKPMRWAQLTLVEDD